MCYTCLSVKEYRCQTAYAGLVKRETGENPVRSRRCNMGIQNQQVTGNGKTVLGYDHRARRPAGIYVHHNHEELVEYMTGSASLFLLANPSAIQKDFLFMQAARGMIQVYLPLPLKQQGGKQTMNETSSKKSNKKLIIACAVLATLIAVFAIAFTIFGPKTSQGSKAITLTVIDNTGAETVYETKTDAQYLSEVFEEIDGLSVEGSEGDYGLYIETVNGLTADYNKDGAYWSIYVNDEYGQFAADAQPVADKDKYSLVYETANAQ